MGAVCCCLHAEEEYVNPNGSSYRNCICLNCFVQNFFNAYTALFCRGEVHAIHSSIEGAASLTSTTSLENSLSDTYRPPPRPLPYDADPRCFRLQRDGLVLRHEKGSSHLHEESEPLRRRDIDSGLESLSAGYNCNGSHCEGGSKEYGSESSVKLSSAKVSSRVGCVYSSSEDEDVCPTCLEVCRQKSVSDIIYSRKPQDNDTMLSSFPPWLYIRVDGEKRKLSSLWQGDGIRRNDLSLLERFMLQMKA
ncbi:hypothetical protein HHK36_015525 [Tetracentron sinense]|uniref:RING-type E3 ubiquitin transferase n=1 Tax=Tetracentron sinense TaxID=13715 RepID=A0A834Z555_TETSI|nr:hypothetical protein HHK36_015525 [Tetracentron sinense]